MIQTELIYVSEMNGLLEPMLEKHAEISLVIHPLLFTVVLIVPLPITMLLPLLMMDLVSMMDLGVCNKSDNVSLLIMLLTIMMLLMMNGNVLGKVLLILESKCLMEI